MEDCIFCKIVNGEIPSFKVYEDDTVFAFLDINPLSKGHVLVLSKEHYENILEVPEDTYAHMAKMTKKISDKVQEVYKPEGILVNQNNGKRAGQQIMHIHIHVKPIYKDTMVFSEANHRKKFDDQKMKKIQKELAID
ncbi:HIT family protein [Candidatus Dojkabacteria bacterium]|nr:HIT family protein [Candidatus Dojkabacteria bacterium]